jgi:hypothetical protein
MSETTAEIKMRAGASNEQSNSAELHQVLHMDHCSAGDARGLKGRFNTISGTAEEKIENLNQPPRV